MTTPNFEFAREMLEGIWSLNRPIGRLMEIVLAMSDGPQRGALKDCSGELLSLQYDLIERLTAAYPALEKVIEARLPPGADPE